MQIPRSQLLERWDRIPGVLREALASDANTDTLRGISTEEHFSDDEREVLAQQVGFVIMGFMRPEELAGEITNELGSTSADAERIAKRVIANILTPLTSEIQKVYKPPTRETPPLRQGSAGQAPAPPVPPSNPFRPTPTLQEVRGPQPFRMPLASQGSGSPTGLAGRPPASVPTPSPYQVSSGNLGGPPRPPVFGATPYKPSVLPPTPLGRVIPPPLKVPLHAPVVVEKTEAPSLESSPASSVAKEVTPPFMLHKEAEAHQSASAKSFKADVTGSPTFQSVHTVEAGPKAAHIEIGEEKAQEKVLRTETQVPRVVHYSDQRSQPFATPPSQISGGNLGGQATSTPVQSDAENITPKSVNITPSAQGTTPFPASTEQMPPPPKTVGLTSAVPPSPQTETIKKVSPLSSSTAADGFDHLDKLGASRLTAGSPFPASGAPQKSTPLPTPLAKPLPPSAPSAKTMPAQHQLAAESGPRSVATPLLKTLPNELTRFEPAPAPKKPTKPPPLPPQSAFARKSTSGMVPAQTLPPTPQKVGPGLPTPPPQPQKVTLRPVVLNIPTPPASPSAIKEGGQTKPPSLVTPNARAITPGPQKTSAQIPLTKPVTPPPQTRPQVVVRPTKPELPPIIVNQTPPPPLRPADFAGQVPPVTPKEPPSITQNITINTGVVDLSMLSGLATGDKGKPPSLEITTKKIEEKLPPKLPVDVKKTPAPPVARPDRGATPPLRPAGSQSSQGFDRQSAGQAGKTGGEMLKVPGGSSPSQISSGNLGGQVQPFAGNDVANLQPALKRSTKVPQKSGDQEVVDLQSLQKTRITINPEEDGNVHP